LASHVRERGPSLDYIIPKMTEWEIYPRVAAAVAMKALKQGVARRSLSYDELYENARKIIENARNHMSSIA
jgi:malate dehydrogenase (oxaloacetate-decarboxylating)/malate dehydrogenase (oxaloacetate-decarboxylating)(NADP+)